VFGLASGNKKRLIIVEDGEASTIHFRKLMKPVSRASIMSGLARKELTAFVARAFLPTSISDSRAGPISARAMAPNKSVFSAALLDVATSWERAAF
jgi:hypothetical protein